MTEANKPAQPLVFGSTEGLGRTLIERLRGGVYGINRIALCDESAAEIERLCAALKKANEQAEEFERAWYLRGDALEKARADFATMRELAQNGAAELGRVVGENARLRTALEHCLDWLPEDSAAACEARALVVSP